MKRATLAVVLVLGPCQPAPAPAPPQLLTYALTSSNQLVAVDLNSGRITSQLQLAPQPHVDVHTRHALAASPDGRSLYALATGGPGADAVVQVVPPAKILRKVPLVSGQARFLAIAVAPHSGDVYALGSVATGPVRDPAHGAPQSSVLLLVHPDGRQRNFTLRPGDDLDWRPWQAAVSPDESRLYVSYHGSDSTGIDWYDLQSDSLERCQLPQKYRGTACLATHGGFTVLGDRVLASGGTADLELYRRDGSLERSYYNLLHRSHTMEFAINAAGQSLYQSAPCSYAGGLSKVDLESGKTTILAPEGYPITICGERMAVTKGGRLVIVSESALLLVEPDTGKPIRTILVRGSPIDVWLPPESSG